MLSSLLVTLGLLPLVPAFPSLAVRAADADPSSTSSSNNQRPIVHLSYGAFQGVSNTTTGVTRFLGMPYAAPPTGQNRLRYPQPPKLVKGVQDASNYAADCPQMNATIPNWFAGLPTDALIALGGAAYGPANAPQSEDCLHINLHVPNGATTSWKKLPVVVWIYGGGFETGRSSAYDGGIVVSRSLNIKQPVIYVNFNYRINAAGWLPGAEIKKAGLANLGFRDQLAALGWVQQHIASFGGDPNRVTIWGESAGAISTTLHVLHAARAPWPRLFSAAVMESGAVLTTPAVDNAAAQDAFDTVVAGAGCSSAKDKIACLRTVPSDKFLQAMQLNPQIFSYQSLNLSYAPHVDGFLIPEQPFQSVAKGIYARVPIISGNCDDEGTLFSFTMTNETTTDQLFDYVRKDWIFSATPQEMKQVAKLYPEDPAAGSPFGTGTANQYAQPFQFKRMSAVQGDLVFQAPRRFFLGHASKTQPVWSFLSKRFKVTPVLGAWHSSDLANFYPTAGNRGTPEGLDRLINFITTHDPNKGAKLSGPAWPSYSNGQQMLVFSDANAAANATTLSVIKDDYRKDAMAYLIKLSLEYH